MFVCQAVKSCRKLWCNSGIKAYEST